MRGRFVIVGLTILAVAGFWVGTTAVPTSATAEFRVPGLFGGKKVVKRKRYRRAAPVQPLRNPDRTFAAVSAKATSPDIAKNSLAALSVGTASAATVSLALPAPRRVADRAGYADEQEDRNKDASKTASDATPSSETDKTRIETAKKEKADTDDKALEAEGAASAKASDTDDAEAERKTATEASDTDDKAETTAIDETEKDSESSTAEAAKSDDKRKATADENTDLKSDEIETAASQASEDDAVDSKTADSKAAGSKTAEKKADADESAHKDKASQEQTTDDKSSDTATAEQTPTKKFESKSADAKAQDDGSAASGGSTRKSEEDVADTSKAAEATEEDSADTETAANATTPATDTKSATDTKEPGAKDPAEVKETAEADGRPDAMSDDAAKPRVAEDKTPESADEEKTAAKDEKSADKAEASDAGADDNKHVTASLPPAPPQKPASARMSGTVNTSEGLAKADGVTDNGDAATDALADKTATPDSRVHDATVILDISPPPSAKTEVGDTEVAALSPELRPSADGPSASDRSDDVATDRESSSDAKTKGKDTKSAAISTEAELSTGRESSTGGADNVSLDLDPPPPPPVDPVIAVVRTKLSSSAPRVASADLEALKAFYGERDDNPLWIAGDGLTQNAKTLIATIGDADDWGLDADAYAVPAANKVLTTDEERADAEAALSAAVLKYARHAQNGRLTPSKAHKLFDFSPKARDPKAVLIEIAESKTPDKALLALHPQHQQYKSLHTALVQARASAKDIGRNPDDDRMVQLIVINMERWRWLPSDLGNFHVWNNIPEFNFRVVKGGREIYKAITIVGQTKYATAFFSAPMRNIVFNPNWTVPPTIVKEDIAPKLKGPQRSGGFFGGRESRNRMLRRYGLTVSRGGKPVDADAVNWQTANVHSYTFQQDPGPHNVLGQFKFNFPNKHAIYMHDTTQKELFGRQVRTLSHGCIRVHQPAQFAAVLLAEDKGWSMGSVQDVLARSQGQTKVISLRRKIPVHLTYNTLVADGFGSVREFGDVYGIDNQMAAKLFKNPAYFNVPFSGAEFAETTPNRRYSEPRRRRGGATTVDDFLSGILGN